MSRIFGIPEALLALRPGAQWTLVGEDYSGIEWLDEQTEKPTQLEVESKITEIQSEYDASEYQRLRAPEYPPVEDYIDGIVKGDQDQVDAYIAACLAVKEKYPKPSV